MLIFRLFGYAKTAGGPRWDTMHPSVRFSTGRSVQLKIRLPVAGADREVDRSERMASVRCAKKIVLVLSSGDRSIWLWMRI